ncbi:MAG TPA: hypothetical protein VKT17_03910 [Acidobacteriota bacterium]|nr:hypothetical protein [Acidobacteriota bacterium]
MNKSGIGPGAYLVAAVVLALAGIGAFVWLSVLNFSLYWLILSPVIIAVYELPAFYAFWLYRRKCRAAASKDRSGAF